MEGRFLVNDSAWGGSGDFRKLYYELVQMTYALDVGRIKFVWQGTWDAATTYKADDVVYKGGSAYICVVTSSVNQDPVTNTAQWNKMAQGSDLGSISGLSANDMVYYDGTDFVRLPVGTNQQSLAPNTSTAVPEWRYAQPILQEQMWVDTVNRGGIASGNPYYFGAVEADAPVITPLRPDSYLRFECQVFGEPSNHNVSGTIQYKITSTGAWTSLPLPTTGSTFHFQMAPYEYTGDYNSTPHQSYCSHGLLVTSTDPVYFRIVIGGGNTMYINRAVSTTYESGISFAVIREINPEFGSITVRT